MNNTKYTNVTSLEALARHGIKKVSVAIGVFDGIHLGHQRLLEELLRMARKTASVPVVLTFYPHPRQILNPEEPPLLLISQEKKIELLHSLGIKAVITFPFTKEFAESDADSFLKECLYSPDVKLCGICVGKKWRFGAGGKGNIRTLDSFAKSAGIIFSSVDEFHIGNHIVSSTTIRRAVRGGLLDLARQMLGRPYSLVGKVEHGENIASKVLRCPTANLSISDGIIPPKGVYAGFAIYEENKFSAAISIGTAPTFKHKDPNHLLVEVHLMDDFKGKIYGGKVEIEFLKYIREERCFPSVNTLREQIRHDLKTIRDHIRKELKNERE